MALPNLCTIGSRSSPLALAQAHLARAALAQALGCAQEQIAIKVISTTGDRTQDRPLSEIGGKGLFTKEIDLAQLEGAVDIAVHSAKDLPNELPEGLAIAGFLAREDIRDALIAPRHKTLDALPPGARLGTVSLRRQALLRHLRPDLRVEPLRGNVETRLGKARSGEFDAVLLAVAGLKRLGLGGEITEALEATRFLPAVGQGAICLVARAGDTGRREAIARIAHAPTGVELSAERAFLKLLDGSCRTPIAGSARAGEGRVAMRGLVLSPDGTRVFSARGEAPAAQAAALGARLGEEIRAQMPPGFLGA